MRRMSAPSSPKLQSVQGRQVWTTYWREPGKKPKCKRFGAAPGVTKKMAEARFRAWLSAEWKPAPETAPCEYPYTAAELAKDYTDYARRTFRKRDEPTSHAIEIEIAMRHMAAAWGDRPLVQVEAHELARLRDQFAVNAQGERMSERTVNGRLSAIKAAAVWAASEKGTIPGAKAAEFKLVGPLRGGRTATRSDPVEAVSDEVVDATLPHLPSVVADMVRLQRLTGMRPSEVCNLSWGQITEDKEVWVYRPPDHKTEHLQKTRLVLLGPKAQAILANYAHRKGLASIFSPQAAFTEAAVKAGRKPPVHTGAIADVYGRDSYRRAVYRGTEKAFALPPEFVWKRTDDAEARRAKAKGRQAWRARHLWHPNQLRHAHATQVRATSGLQAAAAALGHSSMETTLIYAERDYALARSVAVALG